MWACAPSATKQARAISVVTHGVAGQHVLRVTVHSRGLARPAAGIAPTRWSRRTAVVRIADIDHQHAISAVRGESLLNLGNGACAARKKKWRWRACVPYISPRSAPTPDTDAPAFRSEEIYQYGG